MKYTPNSNKRINNVVFNGNKSKHYNICLVKVLNKMYYVLICVVEALDKHYHIGSLIIYENWKTTWELSTDIFERMKSQICEKLV